MKNDPDRKTGKGENIRKLTLPNGLQAGISNLDAILGEVAGLGLTDAEQIKTELLSRVKSCNFVASGAEKDYAAGLLEEYLAKYDESGSAPRRVKHKEPHAG